jgi:hypothetical protein
MRITDNIFINLNDPNYEVTLGIHLDKIQASWTPMGVGGEDLKDEDFVE